MDEQFEIVPYDPTWPVEFKAEAARIRAALDGIALRIDHNGSTAIPGLAAKPIIDIQVSVQSLRPLKTYGGPLQTIGYHHVPHTDDSFCPFFHRPASWPHTHHVHVVQAGGDEERRTLAFRDYLRAHPEAAREYAALKAQLAEAFSGDDFTSREAYAAAKSDFVTQILLLAGGPPPAA